MEPWGPSSLFPADPGAFFPEPSAESPLCSFVPICSILSSSHYKQNQTKARRGPGNGCDAHLTGSWWLSSELCPSFQKAACVSAARRGPGLQDGGWPAAAPGYGGCSTRCRAQLASPARDRCPAGGAEAPPLPCLAFLTLPPICKECQMLSLSSLKNHGTRSKRRKQGPK